VERIVDGRNLTLAERVIKGVVDGGGRQSKTRGAITIDDEINGEAALLLIGIYVGELARFLQRRCQPRRPAVDLCGIAARQGELKCRFRCPPAPPASVQELKKGAPPGILRGLGLSPRHPLPAKILASRRGLGGKKKKPPLGLPPAGEARHM